MAEPETLKASEKGKKLIRAAINNRRRKPSDPVWIIEAQELLCKKEFKESLSKSTWNRFRAGIPIKAITFEVFCEVLQLDVQDITNMSSDNPYHLNERSIKRDLFSDYKSPRIIDESAFI